MALSTRQKVYIGIGVGAIVGLYFLKRKILAAIDTAHAQLQAQAAPGVAGYVQGYGPGGLADLYGAGAHRGRPTMLAGLGDTIPIAPPVAVQSTAATMSAVTGTVNQAVSTATGGITLIMGYLALKEKKQAMAKTG